MISLVVPPRLDIRLVASHSPLVVPPRRLAFTRKK